MACCQYRPAAVRKPDVATSAALAPRPAALLPACGPARARAGRVRRAVLAVAALTAIGGVEARAGEAAPPASDARPLARLLPQTRNHKICFTAHVDDMSVHLAGRNRNAKHAQQRLAGLTAELYWDDAEPIDYNGGWGYDRRYELLLAARVAGHSKPLVGGLECAYRDRAMVDPKTGNVIDGPSATHLACSQDCDGGSLSIEANAGDKSLTLVFKDGQWVRLDGGELSPKSNALRLRLDPAEPSACQPIDDASD